MIKVHSSGGGATEVELGVRTTLGRHTLNTVVINDREVSKEHAVIEQAGNTFVLKDLGSSNGSWVNGRRIKEIRLRDGDEVMLGGTKLQFLGKDGTASPGVTVVGSAQSMPAFLAQISQDEDEFRSVEQVNDIGALRKDYEKLRIAHEFHRQVGLERDAKALFDKILKVAFQLLPADNGVLFLAVDGAGLVPQALLNRQGVQAEDVVVSETVLKRAVETRQAVLTSDAIIDARFSASESIVSQGIRSAMAVPLLAKGALKGVLFLDSRKRTNAFSEKDLLILSGIASQAAVALENAELAQKIEREAVTRAELSRFLSPAVADMVVKGHVELWRVGRLAEVTVLFADIRGFTSMAESDDPQATVDMLNSFFTDAAQVVFQHEGNLDKFIGDCVMAVWGPPSPHPDDAARAVSAALAMQAKVHAYNEERVLLGLKPIEVGIGINTGQAVVGYMGSPERHEFTAIGDSVNTASRLCSLAKGGEVLAAESTVARAGQNFEVVPLPLAQVKGKEKGVKTYRVVGTEESSLTH